MADEKWSGFDIETSTTGVRVVLLYPDGATGTGYKNAQMELSNFFLTLQSQITDNETDILDHENRITDLEDAIKSQVDLNLNSNTTFTLPQNGVIQEIHITAVSGTNINVEIGTTLGGNDLLDYAGTKALGANDYKTKDLIHRNTVSGGDSAAQTIYYTVSGGTVHIHLFYKILATT